MADIVSTRSLIDLNPDSFVDLFEIYIDETTGVLRFHAGKNFNQFIVYKGNKYTPAPIEYGGFQFASDGKQNRPTLRITNIYGIITDSIKNKNDLINSKLKRIKIFVKNLDDANFSDGLNPFFGYRSKRNATNGYGRPFFEENYVINKKNIENKYYIDFELASPIDFENQFLPNRKITDNLCSWSYRGCGCNYGRIPWQSSSTPPNPQTININGSAVSSSSIFGSDSAANIGIPIADENNKKFYSPEGYGLTSIVYRGFWNQTASYNAGDFISYSDSNNYDFFGQKFQFSEDNLSFSVYVCVVANTEKDPRYHKEYWVKDSCSKNLAGCALRWKGHKDGLPFGGFPATRPFGYQV